MRNVVIVLLLGVLVGAAAVHLYHTRELRSRSSPQTETASPSAGAKSTDTADASFIDRAREGAASAKDAIVDKFAEWHLTPDEIKEDLGKTGQVVRSKARSAGGSIAHATSNARIVAVIKARYTLDNELSARTIDIDCDAGKVTLNGTVASTALISKAVALALDTDGVTDVTSKLTVQP